MALPAKTVKAKLQEFGVPAENLDAATNYICSAHATDLDAIREERDTYKRDAETLATVQKELDALKAQPGDGYKDKFEKIKAEYDKFKADTEAEKTLAAKKAAYEEVCKDAGLSPIGMSRALKYADWNTVELDDTGKVKDAKNHIKALREEWADNVLHTTITGVATPNPPANNGGKSIKTKEEIYAIKDAAERQKAILDNHELFGI